VVLDPFTIVAEVFNFVILMLLLRRFLYGPIVRTMDERELHITRDLETAERKEREARHEAAELHRERQELQDHRGELLTQAQLDAEKWHEDLVRRARDEIETRKAGWQQAIEREKESFLNNLRQRAGEQVYEISHRVLSDLADIDLEQHIIDTFVARLRTLQNNELDRVAAAVSAWETTGHGAEQPSPESLVIHTTAYEIDAKTRDQLTAAIRVRLGTAIIVHFEVDPDLICGVELRISGYKAAWSLQNYLETLDEELSLAFTSTETGSQ